METFDKRKLQRYEVALKELKTILKYRRTEKDETTTNAKIGQSIEKVQSVSTYLTNHGVQLDAELSHFFDNLTCRKLCTTGGINMVAKMYRIVKSQQ